MPVHLPRTGVELRLLLDRSLRKHARRMQPEDLSRPDGRRMDGAPTLTLPRKRGRE
jgi:hypothetical protein